MQIYEKKKWPILCILQPHFTYTIIQPNKNLTPQEYEFCKVGLYMCILVLREWWFELISFHHMITNSGWSKHCFAISWSGNIMNTEPLFHFLHWILTILIFLSMTCYLWRSSCHHWISWYISPITPTKSSYPLKK